MKGKASGAGAAKAGSPSVAAGAPRQRAAEKRKAPDSAAQPGKAASPPKQPRKAPPQQGPATPQAKAAAAPCFAPGDRVQLVGLQACPEFNGVCGTVLHFLEERGRWQVDLDADRGSKCVLPANIVLLFTGASAAAPPAARVGRPPSAPPKAKEAPPPREAPAPTAPSKLKQPPPPQQKPQQRQPQKQQQQQQQQQPQQQQEVEPQQQPHGLKRRGRPTKEADGGGGGAAAAAGSKPPPSPRAAAAASRNPEPAVGSGGGAAATLESPPASAAAGRRPESTRSAGAGAAASKPPPAATGKRQERQPRGKAKGAAAAGPGSSKGAADAGSSTTGIVPEGSTSGAPPASAPPAAAAPAAVAPKRLRTKTSSALIEEEAPVAVLIQRLWAAGEAEKGAALDGGADAGDASTRKTAQKASSESVNAELDAMMDDDEEGDELEGEKPLGRRSKATGIKRKQRTISTAVAHADDDDRLFDEEDDLEAEEVVSDDPDVQGVDDEEEDEDDQVWRPVGALAWPDVWSQKPDAPGPGEPGFNEYAGNCIMRSRLGTGNSPFVGLGLRLHQESAAFLMHPTSPITRLLVDHATGTGKTLIMLRILDNFFDDPRPKVAIFPKDRVCDNFYQELLKWPTRWRHYFAFRCPAFASLASGAKDWRRKKADVWDLTNERLRFEAKTRGVRLEKIIGELVDAMRETLEMKNAILSGKIKPAVIRKHMEEHPGAPVPRAPLRAFRYTTAGGCACELNAKGWPRSPILKVGFSKEEMNPYSAKVVIMDECHNLVRPTQKYEEQLGRLRDHLFASQGTVLAGFTGTPVGNDAAEGRRLLDTIKGKAAGELSDEGFVSSFHARGSADFPREVPVAGIPDGVLHEGMFEQLVKPHSMHGEALKRYIMKEVEFQITPRLLRLPQEKRVARLANYCNMHVHYGSFHSANKQALMRDVKGHAPKMHAVAKSISSRKVKAVVMLSREMGYKTMLEVLQRTGKQHGFRVATINELGDFNDAKRNLRGERFRVLVAETSQAGEGVQFRHVRQIHLVDVPVRHSDLVQRTSRCVRLGGHADLPPEERTIAVELHVAQLPKFLRHGPSALVYRELINAKEVASTPGDKLEAAAEACMKSLREKNVKTLLDLQALLQADGGEQYIDLLTETALEVLGHTAAAGARPMAMALWRLRRGGDDLELLEKALTRQVKTADEQLLDWLAEKSEELLPPLEAMRFGAVDRPLLAPLGDPPRAPPPRTEAGKVRCKASLKKLLKKQAAGAKERVGKPAPALAPGSGTGAAVAGEVAAPAAADVQSAGAAHKEDQADEELGLDIEPEFEDEFEAGEEEEEEAVDLDELMAELGAEDLDEDNEDEVDVEEEEL